MASIPGCTFSSEAANSSEAASMLHNPDGSSMLTPPREVGNVRFTLANSFSPQSSPQKVEGVVQSSLSPIKTSEGNAIVVTPEKIKDLKRVVHNHDFAEGEPIGTPQKRIRQGLGDIRGLTDTPVKKELSRSARSVSRELFSQVIGDPDDSQEFHKRAFDLIEQSPTFKSLAEVLLHADKMAQHKAESLPAPPEIINIEHLIKTGCRGFHLCLPNDPVREHLTDYKASANGVYQASFPVDFSNLSGKRKISTFFPLGGVNELIDVILSAKPIANIGNRHLCLVPHQPYLIEMFKNGAVIKSAFPIFYFSSWDEQLFAHPILRDAPPVSTKELLEKAQEAVSQYAKPSLKPNRQNPIRYTIQDELSTQLIIDLALWLPELGIAQGIFIQFPRELFLMDGVDSETLEDICCEP